MLVLNVNAVATVSGLHLAYHGFLYALNALRPQSILRINATCHERIARFYPVAGLDEQFRGGRDLEFRYGVGVGDFDELHRRFLDFLYRNLTADGRNDGFTFRVASFEKLLDSRKTLSYVGVGRYTAGMECSHRQLRSGFAYRLRRYDTDGFADFDLSPARHIGAVALGAYTLLRFAGEHRTDLDGSYACLLDTRRVVLGNKGVRLDEHFAGCGIGYGVDTEASRDPLFKGFYNRTCGILNGGYGESAGVAAIFFLDYDVVRHVDKPSRKITGVGGFKRGVRAALSGAVRRNEVFQNAQSFAEGGFDGDLYDLTGRIVHQSAHTGKLFDLLHRTAGSRIRHHPYRIEFVEFLEVLLEVVRDVLGGFRPDVDGFFVSFVLCHQAAFETSLDGENFFLGFVEDLLLAAGNLHIEHRSGDCAERGILESERFDFVEHHRYRGGSLLFEAPFDDLRKLFLAHKEVYFEFQSVTRLLPFDESERLRNGFVENDLAGGDRQYLFIDHSVDFLLHADVDTRLKVDIAHLISHFRFVGRGEISAFAFGAGLLLREVVGTDNHILRRRNDRFTVAELEDIVGGKHKESRFDLRRYRKRNVHGHLVAVEVRVERRAYERMKFDGSAFHEHGLESLNTQSVKGRRAVQKHGMILDDVFENVPYLGLHSLDGTFRALDILADTHFDELAEHEGLEKFERHFLRKTALIKFKLRSYDYNGTSGIVHALTEQVLTETPLLTAKHVGKGFQVSVPGPGHGFAVLAVVDKGVNRFLKHSLFVADDDVGSARFHHLLQTVVPVDDSAVKVVQVACCESAAVELNHRTKIGRNNGKHVEHHPFGTVAGSAESLHYIQTFSRFLLLVAGGIGDYLFKLGALRFEVYLAKQNFERFGAHSHFESVGTVLLERFAIFVVFDDLFLVELSFARIEHHERRVVYDLLDLLRTHIEYGADTARHSAEIPNVRHGRSKLHVSHSFATDFRLGDFNAALVADDTFITYPLILAAMAFVILRGPEYFLAEKTVLFGLLRSVVNGFGFGDLAVRPLSDFLGRSERNLHCVETVDLYHLCYLLFLVVAFEFAFEQIFAVEIARVGEIGYRIAA